MSVSNTSHGLFLHFLRSSRAQISKILRRIKASLLIFSTFFLWFLLYRQTCSSCQSWRHHYRPQLGHYNVASTGVFKRVWFLLHFIFDRKASVSSKKRKEKTSFNISNTDTFRIKQVGGSSITICASSVHEYPSFFVRSVSGITTVLFASLKSKITPPKVGYNSLSHSRQK